MFVSLLNIQFAKHTWLTRSDPAIQAFISVIRTKPRICLLLANAFWGFPNNLLYKPSQPIS
jgi:hypothetical protein